MKALKTEFVIAAFMFSGIATGYGCHGHQPPRHASRGHHQGLEHPVARSPEKKTPVKKTEEHKQTRSSGSQPPKPAQDSVSDRPSAGQQIKTIAVVIDVSASMRGFAAARSGPLAQLSGAVDAAWTRMATQGSRARVQYYALGKSLVKARPQTLWDSRTYHAPGADIAGGMKRFLEHPEMGDMMILITDGQPTSRVPNGVCSLTSMESPAELQQIFQDAREHNMGAWMVMMKPDFDGRFYMNCGIPRPDMCAYINKHFDKFRCPACQHRHRTRECSFHFNGRRTLLMMIVARSNVIPAAISFVQGLKASLQPGLRPFVLQLFPVPGYAFKLDPRLWISKITRRHIQVQHVTLTSRKNTVEDRCNAERGLGLGLVFNLKSGIDMSSPIRWLPQVEIQPADLMGKSLGIFPYHEGMDPQIKTTLEESDPGQHKTCLPVLNRLSRDINSGMIANGHAIDEGAYMILAPCGCAAFTERRHSMKFTVRFTQKLEDRTTQLIATLKQQGYLLDQNSDWFKRPDRLLFLDILVRAASGEVNRAVGKPRSEEFHVRFRKIMVR